jgi:MFS family permease
MGVDALAALLFGRWFDRLGLGVLMVSTLLSACFAPLAFLGGLTTALAGVALWGIGLGAQESILRATVAGMVRPDRRGWAFGVFNAAYGIAWFLGSALMGFLYDRSPDELIAFSVLAQLAALPLLWVVARGGRGPTGAPRP